MLNLLFVVLNVELLMQLINQLSSLYKWWLAIMTPAVNEQSLLKERGSTRLKQTQEKSYCEITVKIMQLLA